MSRIIDVSRPVAVGIPVWPGDEAYACGWTMRRDEGESVNVAHLGMSPHTGTHVDGPYHVVDDGARIGAVPLEPFVGPALVIDAGGAASLGEDAVRGVDLRGAERVLFRTRAWRDPDEFPRDFAAIEPALAERLAAAGVKLVGTDAPSIDPMGSKELESHRVLIGAGAAILENVALDDVAPGAYTLIALPLRLMEADASPVRAVLIEGD